MYNSYLKTEKNRNARNILDAYRDEYYYEEQCKRAHGIDTTNHFRQINAMQWKRIMWKVRSKNETQNSKWEKLRGIATNKYHCFFS